MPTHDAIQDQINQLEFQLAARNKHIESLLAENRKLSSELRYCEENYAKSHDALKQQYAALYDACKNFGMVMENSFRIP